MEEEDICETNVDQLRKPWEIEDHWQLRREFILEHKDKFERERLLCLSQLCVNIETMGNVYDDDLMSTIENLASDLPTVKNFRQLRNNQVEASKSARSQRKRQKDEEETRFNHNRMGNFNANNNQNPSYHNSYQASKKPRFDSPGYGNQGNNRNQSYNQEQRPYGRQAGGSYQDAYAQPPYGTRRPNAYTQRERPAQNNFQQPQRSRTFQQQQQQQQPQKPQHSNPQQPRQNFKRQNAASFFQQQYQQHLDSSIPSYSTTSYSEG